MKLILATVTTIGLLLGSVGAASAAGAVVVNHTGQHGWNVLVTSPDGSATFVNGPAAPPLGTGSLRLQTGTHGDESAQIRNTLYAGTKLSALSGLGYWTYDVTNNGQQFPYLGLTISSSGTGAADDILFFEPPYQSVGNGGTDCAHQAVTVMNTWQKWDALSGCWWDNNGVLNPGTGTGTLADYLVLYPNATIVNTSGGLGGVRLLVGFASLTDVFDGNVDAFTIGVGTTSTTYDFEAGLPTPTNKDQCKGGGWQQLARADGSTFKNQGDCIQYVNTGK